MTNRDKTMFKSFVTVASVVLAANVAVAGTRGPDAGGYTVTSDEAYSFIDISSGTAILAGTEDAGYDLQLGFTFGFYGRQYTSICVMTNGLISFGPCSPSVVGAFTNQDLSTVAGDVDAPLIAVFWDDLNFMDSASDAVHYVLSGAPGSRVLTIQWNNAVHDNETNPVTFQAMLYEGTNQIRFQYRDVDSGNGYEASSGGSATVGIRSSTAFLQWSSDAPVLSPFTALLFTPSGTCQFSMPTRESGISHAGGSGQIQLNVSGSSCPWSAAVTAPWITITSETAGNASTTLRYQVAPNAGTTQRAASITAGGATFTITQPPAARLTATPASVSWSTREREPRSVTLSVDAQITAATAVSISSPSASDAPWLAVSSASQRTTPFQLVFTLSPGTLSPGTYEATIGISSPDAGNYLSIPVYMTIEDRNSTSTEPQPTLAVSQPDITFTENSGVLPTPKTVAITSTRTGTWTLQDAPAWITATPANGSLPADIRVQADGRSLRPGWHTGVVTVRSSYGESIGFRVSLNVVSGLSATMDSVSFESLTRETAPQERSITVTGSAPGTVVTATAKVTTPAGGSWLSVNPARGTSPAALKVTASAAGLRAGRYEGYVEVASGGSTLRIPVTFTVAEPPARPAPAASIANGASFDATSGLAPNTISSLFGTGLACPAGPKEVLVAGSPAEVLHWSDTQVNFVVPPAPLTGSATVQVRCAARELASLSKPAAHAAPAVFTLDFTGKGPAAALNQDYSINRAGHPAAPGSVLMLYVSGLGEYEEPSTDGLKRTRNTITAYVNERPVEVLYAGQAPGFTPGLQQVNIRLPEDLAPDAAAKVRLEAAGLLTQREVTISVGN